ncbi:MAG: diguanylate cyclase [Alphaproteobacteria bacterium]|nr:diguanylate cyclase [Alphaproteobacteria bacterium]
MTSDILQDQTSHNAPAPSWTLAKMPAQSPSANTLHLRKNIELSRDAGFIEGRHDIFDLLARHGHEKDALERSLGATIALLRRSGDMLREAEETIEVQNARLAQLNEQIRIEPVSGLLSRRGFAEILTREVARTNRGQNSGGLLVMFSLENLSRIRRQHGSKAANRAVELITKALKDETRIEDHAARICDEEFILLFTATQMKDALERLQNMAMRLNKLSLIWDGREIRLNLSLGLKTYETGEDAEEIFTALNEDLQRNRKGQAMAR